MKKVVPDLLIKIDARATVDAKAGERLERIFYAS